MSTLSETVGRNPAPLYLVKNDSIINTTMQGTLPITITSQGMIKQLHLSLQFDPTQLANPSVIPAQGVTGSLSWFPNGNHFGIKLDNATIPAGTVPVLNVTFDIVGGNGDSYVALWSDPVPFEAFDTTGHSLSLGSNAGGLVNLQTGNGQAATIIVSGETLTAQIVLSDPIIPTPTPITPNPVSTIVPPQPIIVSNPQPVITPIAPAAVAPSLLSSLDMSGVVSNLVATVETHAVLIGAGLLGYFLLKDKKKRR